MATARRVPRRLSRQGHALRGVRGQGRARAPRRAGRGSRGGEPRHRAGHRLARSRRAPGSPALRTRRRRRRLRRVPEETAATPRGRGPRAGRARAEDRRAPRRGCSWASALSVPVLRRQHARDVFPWAPAWLRNPWVLLALTTPVQFWVGWPFHAGFLHELRHRSASMTTLVSIGTNAAYFFSLAVTLWPHRFMAPGAMPYYETSALLITLVVLGRWLEARARGRTSDAIRRLVALRPARRGCCAQAARSTCPSRRWRSATGSASGPGSACRWTGSWRRAPPPWTSRC